MEYGFEPSGGGILFGIEAIGGGGGGTWSDWQGLLVLDRMNLVILDLKTKRR